MDSLVIRSRHWLGTACVLAALALGLLSLPRSASAQTLENRVDPDFKGSIGLGLVGAELGFVIPALAGLRDTWAYIVFPVVGAGGGGLAGYFAIEQGTGSSELAVATLITGMALIIPAMVVTLSATAYDPAEQMSSSARAAPPALLQVSERGLHVGAPAVAFFEGASAREALRTGASPADRARELRVSLVSGHF